MVPLFPSWLGKQSENEKLADNEESFVCVCSLKNGKYKGEIKTFPQTTFISSRVNVHTNLISHYQI